MEKKKSKDIQSQLIGNSLTSNSKKAYTNSKVNFFGEKTGEKISYSLFEGMYLLEIQKMSIYYNNKELSQEEAMKKFSKIDKKFIEKYSVYKDLRKKGYIVKSALKFGAEFSVYDKGKKPGKSHSKWIVFTESNNSKSNWHEFSSKNRVAHSTNKNLLIAIIDEEQKPIYYEISWKKF